MVPNYYLRASFCNLNIYLLNYLLRQFTEVFWWRNFQLYYFFFTSASSFNNFSQHTSQTQTSTQRRNQFSFFTARATGCVACTHVDFVERPSRKLKTIIAGIIKRRERTCPTAAHQFRNPSSQLSTAESKTSNTYRRTHTCVSALSRTSLRSKFDYCTRALIRGLDCDRMH